MMRCLYFSASLVSCRLRHQVIGEKNDDDESCDEKETAKVCLPEEHPTLGPISRPAGRQ